MSAEGFTVVAESAVEQVDFVELLSALEDRMALRYELDGEIAELSEIVKSSQYGEDPEQTPTVVVEDWTQLLEELEDLMACRYRISKEIDELSAIVKGATSGQAE